MCVLCYARECVERALSVYALLKLAHPHAEVNVCVPEPVFKHLRWTQEVFGLRATEVGTRSEGDLFFLVFDESCATLIQDIYNRLVSACDESECLQRLVRNELRCAMFIENANFSVAGHDRDLEQVFIDRIVVLSELSLRLTRALEVMFSSDTEVTPSITDDDGVAIVYKAASFRRNEDSQS